MLPATGALTQLGPQINEVNSSDVRDIAHSPDGKFFYTSDDTTSVHAFSVDTTTGVIAELAGSPYLGGAGQIVADVTGKFVYVGDQEVTGQVIGYTRDATTGALTLIGNTTTAHASAGLFSSAGLLAAQILRHCFSVLGMQSGFFSKLATP